MRRRLAVALLAAGVVACSAADAAATVTLKLVFPDGQPMTYGSACAGQGCLASGNGVDETDRRGQVYLDDHTHTIEYRRDGIDLATAPAGTASGTTVAVGNSATVVLPHLLTASAPEVDAAESDLVARLNEARAAQGLPLAQLNPQLSAAADLQAAWLTQSGATVDQGDRFHIGPFSTDLAFRHGEVSLPDPDAGAEIAEAGGTIEETTADWLTSAEHRAVVLAPGPWLIGVGRAGSFVIVETHKPCPGCERKGTGTRATDFPAPPPPVVAAPPAPPVAPPLAPAAAVAPLPKCGREQLATHRLQKRRGRVRVRIGLHCLRPGGRYVLLIRQGTSGKLLKSIRIKHAKSMTLRLRPAPTVHRLRIKVKRDGRTIFGRTMSLRKK